MDLCTVFVCVDLGFDKSFLGHLHIHYLGMLVPECFVQMEDIDVTVNSCVQGRGKMVNIQCFENVTKTS